MSTKSKWIGGILKFFDSSSYETVKALAPVTFYDDFIAKTLDTTNTWNLRDTANATEALVADAPNGVVALTLTNANEAQEAGMDWNDNRTLVLNQGLEAEFRYRFTTLPASASIATLGLCGDYNADPDAVAESIWFRHDGSGAITVETDDTSHESSKVATGVTLAANDWAVVRIDCSDTADVKFYVNGNRVAASATFNMSQVAALKLQPSVRMTKAAAVANVGVMELDYVRCWQKRA